MIDHIDLRVSDLRASRRFYEAALAPLEIVVVKDSPRVVTFGAGTTHAFTLHQSDLPTRAVHVAFAAPSQAAVDRFHRDALRAGARDNGEPGERTGYHA